ncbi:MAG: MopE-related protein, partial [Myxococcota bacterium]|nr:MopE-related protein [Myxococcota bacterium]
MKGWILVLGFGLLMACGDPGDNDSSTCTSGATVSCVCADGQTGIGTCTDAGTVANCICQSGGGPCTVGTTQACTTTCNTQGTAACINGTLGACEPPPESTNGIDDDCDAQIDESASGAGECIAGQTEACITSCTSIGIRTCGATGQWAQCLPPEEECNNKDDDCDGKIDDGMQRNCQTACGTGTEVCTDGSWQACTAATPETEICVGLDNDCDGKTDLAANGTPLEETCDEGCGVGSRSCINGAWGSCSAVPDAEICDGLDNDCNGTIDDPVGGCNCIQGQQQPCGKTDGECNPGVQQCIGGQWTQCGGDNFQGENEEQCNGLDDDCDGVTDEGNPEGGSPCGTPNETQGGEAGLKLPCQIGLISCLNGQLQCVGGVDPGPELCDGIDN